MSINEPIIMAHLYPVRRPPGWTTLSGEADEVVRLRAEVKLLREGIRALRRYAKERSFTVYMESVVTACDTLLNEEAP